MGRKHKELSDLDKELIDDSEEEEIPVKKRRGKQKEEIVEPEIAEDEEITEPKRKKKTKEEFDFNIRHTHDAKLIKVLRSRGVSPLDIMHGAKHFCLDDVVQPITAQAFGKVKKINVNKQLTWYEKSYNKVLGQSWLSAGIGGFPSDARAKQVALHIFIKAIREYQERDPRKNMNRSLPLWHHVYGGFGDTLRDMKSDFPAFVVISNITPECTALKLEKVRDCLTRYNNMDIPVLVVTAGMDPYTFFTTKVYYPMRWGLHIGNQLIEV